MLVDEVQAAACSSAACTGSPSRKRTPSISWPRRSEPSRQRQRRSADLASLKTIASAVCRDRQPLVLSVRSRTVAKVLSMGFVVRTCFHVLSWKVVESKQHLAILGQAGHGFVVLGPILGDEAVEGGLGCLAVLSFVDGVQ